MVSDGENEERRIEKRSKGPFSHSVPALIDQKYSTSLYSLRRDCLQMIGLECVYCLDIVLKEDCI